MNHPFDTRRASASMAAAMRDYRSPQSKAKLLLLDAAEQLFADRGFEAVSIRDVTQAAKANVAAVNYHFGSRDGLVAAVVMRHLVPLNEERLARLDLAERKWPGKSIPLEEILDAYVRPLFGGARKSALAERAFCRLIGRVCGLPGDVLPPEVEPQAKSLHERFSRAFMKALPGLSQEEAGWRMHFALGAAIHTLLNPEPGPPGGGAVAAAAPVETAIGRFIRFAACGMRDGTAAEATPRPGPQATFDF